MDELLFDILYQEFERDVLEIEDIPPAYYDLLVPKVEETVCLGSKLRAEDGWEDGDSVVYRVMSIRRIIEKDRNVKIIVVIKEIERGK